jgi:hypothetical protein
MAFFILPLSSTLDWYIFILVQSNNEVIHEYMWIFILVQSNNEVIHEYMWIIILVQSNNEVIHEYMWIILLVQSEWFIFVIRNKNSYTIYYIGLMVLFILIRCLIKTGFSWFMNNFIVRLNKDENSHVFMNNFIVRFLVIFVLIFRIQE